MCLQYEVSPQGGTDGLKYPTDALEITCDTHRKISGREGETKRERRSIERKIPTGCGSVYWMEIKKKDEKIKNKTAKKEEVDKSQGGAPKDLTEEQEEENFLLEEKRKRIMM